MRDALPPPGDGIAPARANPPARATEFVEHLAVLLEFHSSDDRDQQMADPVRSWEPFIRGSEGDEPPDPTTLLIVTESGARLLVEVSVLPSETGGRR